MPRSMPTVGLGEIGCDLRTFHDILACARLAPLPPLPRATVILTERIVNDLKQVDMELREVLTALGLPESSS